MAQSSPLHVYTTEQVLQIARRARRYPQSITLSELRVLALHALEMYYDHH